MSESPSDTRTSVSDVRSVTGTSLDEEAIQLHIEDASFEVTERLDNTGMSEERLERIERYLAAHLIAIGPDRQIQSGGSQTSSVRFTGEFGEGLKSTTFGQKVLSLDTSGILENEMRDSASIDIPDSRGIE